MEAGRGGALSGALVIPYFSGRSNKDSFASEKPDVL